MSKEIYEESSKDWQLLEKDQRIADLEAKLAESEESCILLEGLRKSEAEKKDIAMKRVTELKQQLEEKEVDILALDTDNYSFKQQIDNLRQQLAEKDKQILELQEDSIRDNQIYNKELAEKEQTIEELNKEFVQAVKDWKLLVEQKEKEIEEITKVVAYRDDMDRSTTINGVKFTNEQIITLQNIDYFADKHNQDKISFALEQLEKVKEYIKGSLSNGTDDDWDFALSTIDKEVNNQIKQLKGK